MCLMHHRYHRARAAEAACTPAAIRARSELSRAVSAHGGVADPPYGGTVHAAVPYSWVHYAHSPPMQYPVAVHVHG